jgi:phosphatidylglycerophosphate synthase
VKEYSYAQIRSGRLKEQVLYFKLHAWLTSAPVAWLCYKVGLSANRVTALAMALALPAAALNATGHFYWAIVVFHVFYVFDCADGVLARGTATTSMVGAYLDDLAHYVFHSVYFLSLATGLALSGQVMSALLAMAAGLGNNLQRAHRDLVKVRGEASAVGNASTEKAPASGRMMHSILRSFDFPNVLVFLTCVSWQSTLLKYYLAYCVVMNFSYLAWCASRHVSCLKRSQPVISKRLRAAS